MNLVYNFIAVLLFFFAEYAVRAVIPLFITDYLDFSRTYSGYFMGIFSIGGMVAKFITGAIADRFGKLRVYGIYLILSSIVVYFYGFFVSIYILMIVRLMHGFCSGAVRTIYQPVTVSLAKQQHLSRAIGITGTGAMAAMVVVAPIAVMFVDIWSYRIFFTTAAILCLSAFLMVLPIKLKEPAPVRTGGLGTFIEISSVLPFAMLRFVHSAAHGIFMAYGIIFAKEVSLINSGLFLTAFALGNATFRSLTGFVMDRIKKWYIIMIVAYLMIIVGYTIFSFQFFILGAFLVGAGSGIDYTAINSEVFNNIGDRSMNRISATMETVVSVGAGAGAVLSGLTYTGPLNWMFLFIGGLYIVQIGLLFAYARWKERHSTVVSQ